MNSTPSTRCYACGHQTPWVHWVTDIPLCSPECGRSPIRAMGKRESALVASTLASLRRTGLPNTVLQEDLNKTTMAMTLPIYNKYEEGKGVTLQGPEDATFHSLVAPASPQDGEFFGIWIKGSPGSVRPILSVQVTRYHTDDIGVNRDTGIFASEVPMRGGLSTFDRFPVNLGEVFEVTHHGMSTNGTIYYVWTSKYPNGWLVKVGIVFTTRAGKAFNRRIEIPWDGATLAYKVDAYLDYTEDIVVVTVFGKRSGTDQTITSLVVSMSDGRILGEPSARHPGPLTHRQFVPKFDRIDGSAVVGVALLVGGVVLLGDYKRKMQKLSNEAFSNAHASSVFLSVSRRDEFFVTSFKRDPSTSETDWSVAKIDAVSVRGGTLVNVGSWSPELTPEKSSVVCVGGPHGRGRHVVGFTPGNARVEVFKGVPSA